VRSYGEQWAEIYDDIWLRRFAEVTPLTASLLAELAGDGPALELGVGTGRVALALADQGVEVHGVDASEAMVARLRAKPGGDRIAVTIGDFADVPVEGDYPLVFVVFNTLFALLTQEAQVRCFAGVANHLIDDGVFVVEAFVPDLTLFDRNQRVAVNEVRPDGVWLDLGRLDPVAQRVSAQQVFLSEGSTKLRPIELRYSWPSELDLMARLAGLTLRDRWGGWDKEPFDSASPSHVSVYEKV
jgi:SAM-dependent methyltransferase